MIKARAGDNSKLKTSRESLASTLSSIRDGEKSNTLIVKLKKIERVKVNTQNGSN